MCRSILFLFVLGDDFCVIYAINYMSLVRMVNSCLGGEIQYDLEEARHIIHKIFIISTQRLCQSEKKWYMDLNVGHFKQNTMGIRLLLFL